MVLTCAQGLCSNVSKVASRPDVNQLYLSVIHVFLEEGKSHGHMFHTLSRVVGVAKHTCCFVVTEDEHRLRWVNTQEFQDRFHPE